LPRCVVQERLDVGFRNELRVAKVRLLGVPFDRKDPMQRLSKLVEE